MKPFKCINCGECCGPVPVNQSELNRIQEKVKRMPNEKVNRLKNQKRPPLTCMLRDVEKNKCSIYEVRPEICRMFGSYEGMACEHNPDHATKGRIEGMERLLKNGDVVGILSIHYTWENLLEKK